MNNLQDIISKAKELSKGGPFLSMRTCLDVGMHNIEVLNKHRDDMCTIIKTHLEAGGTAWRMGPDKILKMIAPKETSIQVFHILTGVLWEDPGDEAIQAQTDAIRGLI